MEAKHSNRPRNFVVDRIKHGVDSRITREEKSLHPAFRVLIAAFVMCALVSCGGGGDGSSGGSTRPPPFTTPPATGQTATLNISSAQVGTQYTIYTWVPADYASGQGSYPVIYALDGNDNFFRMANVLSDNQIKAILVAIGRGDRRATDYLLPGARNYYNFITLELIPFIEAEYRARSDNRTIAGHSYGGLFVGLALFMDRLGGRYFKNFVSQDGTFSVNAAATADLEQQTFDNSGGQLPVTLIMSGAPCCYYADMSSFYDKLMNRNYQGLDAHRLPPYAEGQTYNEGHIAMIMPSFADSMRILFP